MAKTRSYGEDWNAYVRDWKEYAAREPGARKDQEFVYPGDEWGNQEEWDRVANRYLLLLLPDDDQGIAVELGGGSGK